VASASCRAAVEKKYDDGRDEHVDPKTGGMVVVTTSDPCGLIIEPVQFERDSVRFSTRSADAVAGMLACLHQTEQSLFRFELIGHASGDERDPEQLGLARARALADYLTACGVPMLGKITPTSAGNRDPVDRSGTEQSLTRNRRVDFLIVERHPQR
jgi:outer membrane protein OmpA-like peptidoglycan-associated protein